MDSEQVLKWLGVLMALLGGGSIFYVWYAPRGEKAKVQSAEEDVRLKQIEFQQNQIDTIIKLSTALNSATVKLAIAERQLADVKVELRMIRKIARKLYEEIDNTDMLTKEEIDLLNVLDTIDLKEQL